MHPSKETITTNTIFDQLAEGEDTLNIISNNEGWDEIEYPSRFKILFSLFESTPISLSDAFVKTNISSAIGVIIKANGLIVSDKFYPFKQKYRDELHFSIMQTFASRTQTSRGLSKDIKEMNKFWKEYFIKTIIHECKKQIGEEMRLEIENLRKREAEPFMNNKIADYQEQAIGELFPTLTPAKIKQLHAELIKFNRKHDKSEASIMQQLKQRTKSDIEKGATDASFYKKLNTTIKQFEKCISEKYNIDFNYRKTRSSDKHCFVKEFEKFLIKDGRFTKYELDEYHQFDKNNQKQIESTIRLIEKYEKRKGFETIVPYFESKPITKRPIGDKHHRTKHSTRVRKLYDDVKLSVKRECWYKYNKETDSFHPYKVPIYHFHINDITSAKDAKQRFITFIKAVIPVSQKHATDMYNAYRISCEHYYGFLMPKYRESFIEWGRIPDSVHERTAGKIKILRKNFRKTHDKDAKELAMFKYDTLLEKLCLTFSTPDTKIINIIMTPICMFLETTDKKILTKSFTPSDDIIKQNLDESELMCWLKAWRQIYRKSIPVYDNIIRHTVNEYINETLMKNYKILSAEDHNMCELAKQFNLNLPTIISTLNGQINDSISTENIELLREIMPYYNKYICALSYSYTADAPIDFKQTIQEYISGESTGYNELIHRTDKRFTLNIKALSKWADTSNFDTPELLTVISAHMAMVLCATLNKEDMANFKSLVCDDLSISKIAFYKISGKRIDSPIERQNLMLRAVFIREFHKVIMNESSDEIQNFIQALIP